MLIYTSNNRPFRHFWIHSKSSIMTTKIQQEDFIRGILFFFSFFIRDPKAPQVKNIAHNLFLNQIWFQFCCKFRVVRLKIPKTQCDWIDQACKQKLQLLSVCRVRQPWIRENECLSTIPFARNTDHELQACTTVVQAHNCMVQARCLYQPCKRDLSPVPRTGHIPTLEACPCLCPRDPVPVSVPGTGSIPTMEPVPV